MWPQTFVVKSRAHRPFRGVPQKNEAPTNAQIVILLQRQLRITALAHDAASLGKLIARLANGAISNRVSATTNALVAPFAMSTACNNGLLALPHVGHTVHIEGGGSGVVGGGQERHDKKGGEE